MIGKLVNKCAINTIDKSILAIVDTTEINCQGHFNRLQSKNKLGPLSDNKTLGYYLQPILCLDQSTKFPLGVADVHIWNRTGEPLIDHKKRFLTDRESNKWYGPVKRSRETILDSAQHVTYVMDREADSYEVLQSIPDDKTDFVVRSSHDRLVLHNGEKMHLGAFLSALPVKGKLRITIQSHQRAGHAIEANVKYGQVEIPKVKNGKYLPQTRDTMTVYVVEVEELNSHHNTDKIYWRLLTSIQIHTLEQAKQIVDIYKSRWHIEEMFRLMKTEAFDIESSELEKPENLFKLGILVMEASMIIAQLKAVRDKESEIKVETVFTPDEIECLRGLDLSLKGSTEKQSNPFNPQSLSWAAWIIARLGGWKGYQSQRPPGSITYKRGLEIFYDTNEGFQIARLMYKR